LATLQLRFRDGSEQTFELHERMDTKDLARSLTNGMAARSVHSMGIAAEYSETPADYGLIGFGMADVLWWHIDGMVHENALLGPWAEADSLAQQDGDDPGPERPERSHLRRDHGPFYHRGRRRWPG